MKKEKKILLTFFAFSLCWSFWYTFFFTYRQCLSSSSTLSSTLPNHKLPTLNTSLPENVTTTELHSFLQLLNANTMIRAMTKNGDVVVLNSNNELCFHLFGYHINDVLCTSKGKTNMYYIKQVKKKEREHGNSFNAFLQSHF